MATRQPPSHSIAPPGSSTVAETWFEHSSARRINTDVQIYDAIKAAHPGLEVTIVPVFNADLKSYAVYENSNASIHPVPTTTANDPPAPHHTPTSLAWLMYIPPSKRLDGGTGTLATLAYFESYLYRWSSHEFLVYYVDGRDSDPGYMQTQNQYIVSNDIPAVHTLISTVGRWMVALHDQIWVFDQGFWQQDAALYASIMKSDWKDVILDKSLKEDLIDTITRFFKSREEYRKLRVPWKRGILFYGPPGNGKTISIKATMHTLYSLPTPIPTLYVKSLKSWSGPEASITQIFMLARREAPCYLVFEDLDSLISPDVRSFFLNAVDGLSENEGILMVGSTNHLEQLDPGIAKRPSRFDRKYLFDDPDQRQRTRYCDYWRRKLRENKDVEFPGVLTGALARLMEGFSFAYMQEAFVSALLGMANEKIGDGDGEEEMREMEERWEWLNLGEMEEKVKKGGNWNSGNDDGELMKYVLYRRVKKQVELLRKELSKD